MGNFKNRLKDSLWLKLRNFLNIINFKLFCLNNLIYWSLISINFSVWIKLGNPFNSQSKFCLWLPPAKKIFLKEDEKINQIKTKLLKNKNDSYLLFKINSKFALIFWSINFKKLNNKNTIILSFFFFYIYNKL